MLPKDFCFPPKDYPSSTNLHYFIFSYLHYFLFSFLDYFVFYYSNVLPSGWPVSLNTKTSWTCVHVNLFPFEASSLDSATTVSSGPEKGSNSLMQNVFVRRTWVFCWVFSIVFSRLSAVSEWFVVYLVAVGGCGWECRLLLWTTIIIIIMSVLEWKPFGWNLVSTGNETTVVRFGSHLLTLVNVVSVTLGMGNTVVGWDRLDIWELWLIIVFVGCLESRTVGVIVDI